MSDACDDCNRSLGNSQRADGHAAAARPRPTTDAAPLRASYCSHTDGEGTVVFDPIFFGVYWDVGDTATLERCLKKKRGMGLTDVCIAVQGGYRDYLNGATFDWRATPSKLHDLGAWLLARGSVP